MGGPLNKDRFLAVARDSAGAAAGAPFRAAFPAPSAPKRRRGPCARPPTRPPRKRPGVPLTGSMRRGRLANHAAPVGQPGSGRGVKYGSAPRRPWTTCTGRSTGSSGEFIDNDIQLLETQRKYAWGKEQVCELIDSIYKGYPSGSILLWETDGPPRVRGAAASKGPGRPASGPSYLLLDGHQRLASLAAVLASMPVRAGGGQAAARPVEIHFNMGHPENPTTEDMKEGRRIGDEECKQRPGRADHPIFRLKSRGAEGGGQGVDTRHEAVQGGCRLSHR